jgi:hypothetical protein
MKHPNYPKAKNEYLGTTTTPLNTTSRQTLNETMKDFAVHLNAIIARKEKEKQDRLNQTF